MRGQRLDLMGADADKANAIEKGMGQDEADVKVEMNDDRIFPPLTEILGAEEFGI